MNEYQINKLEFEEPEKDFLENSNEVSKNRYTAMYT